MFRDCLLEGVTASAGPPAKKPRWPPLSTGAARRLGLLACLFALSLTNACATSGPARFRQTSPIDGRAVSRDLAREVLLLVRGDTAVLGKVTAFRGDLVTFLPSPYWNVEGRTIAMDDIVLIDSPEMKSSVGRSAILGFVSGFVLVGVLAGSGAEYDSDYQSALSAAGAAGVLGGVVGALIGVARDHSETRTWRFESMSPQEKRNALWQITGR